MKRHILWIGLGGWLLGLICGSLIILYFRDPALDRERFRQQCLDFAYRNSISYKEKQVTGNDMAGFILANRSKISENIRESFSYGGGYRNQKNSEGPYGRFEIVWPGICVQDDIEKSEISFRTIKKENSDQYIYTIIRSDGSIVTRKIN